MAKETGQHNQAGKNTTGKSEPAAEAKSAAPMPADIWVLVVAAFIVAIGFGIISPLLPQFAASFDLGITASSIVVSAFAVFRLVFAPGAGRLLDRVGERPVYVIGLLIVAASTFLVALAQNYWQLLIFRSLGGFGSAMFTVSATALIIRIAPPTARGRATGHYATAFLLGSIAGPVLGGLMAGWGMRIPFIIYAIALVIAAIVVRVWLGATGADKKAKTGSQPPAAEVPTVTGEMPEISTTEVARASAAETAASADGADTRATGAHPEGRRAPMRFREAWQHSAYRAALFGGFTNGWASMGIRMALYPLFALQVLGVGSSEAGLALTVFAAGTALAVATVGRLSDRWGRKPFVLAGFAVLGVSTILLGMWESLAVFLLLSVVAGLGAGMLNPAQQAAIADIVGNDRPGGKVISRFQMSMDAGAILGPILAATLVDAMSFEAAFVLSGVLSVVAALAWAFAKETLPRTERT